MGPAPPLYQLKAPGGGGGAAVCGFLHPQYRGVGGAVVVVLGFGGGGGWGGCGRRGVVDCLVGSGGGRRGRGGWVWGVAGRGADFGDRAQHGGQVDVHPVRVSCLLFPSRLSIHACTNTNKHITTKQQKNTGARASPCCSRSAAPSSRATPWNGRPWTGSCAGWAPATRSCGVSNS